MTSAPRHYWTERGKDYEANFVYTEHRRRQEEVLARFLAQLEFATVLDVGCGFGRIGAPLVNARPAVAYTGIDYSGDMLLSASKKIPTGYFRQVSLEKFAPTHRFDLVLAVEVLMHYPPQNVKAAVEKLRVLSRRHLVTVDWSRPLPDGHRYDHNWVHPYPTLYGEALVAEIPIGYQTLYQVDAA